MAKSIAGLFIILLSYLGIGLSQQIKSNVECCPSNEIFWNLRKKDISCDKAKDYHCMQTRNGKFAEFCASISIISLGMCPVTEKGSQIDGHVRCSSKTRSCPQDGVMYISSQLYIYPGCFTPCENATFAKEVVTISESRTTNHNLPNDTASTDKIPNKMEINLVNINTSEHLKTDDTSVIYEIRPYGSTSKVTIYLVGGDGGGSSNTNYMVTVFTYGGIAALAVVFVLVLAVCILLVQRFKGRKKPLCRSQENIPQSPVTPSMSRGPLPEIPKIKIKTEYEYTYDDNVVLKKDEFSLGTCTSFSDVAYESPTTITKYESLIEVSTDTESERKVYDSLENIKMTPSNQNCKEINRDKKCVSI